MSLAAFYKLYAAKTLASSRAQCVTPTMCRSASANPARAVTISYANPHIAHTCEIRSPQPTRTTELRASSATRRFLASERLFERERAQKPLISELKQRDTCYRLYEYGYSGILKKEAVNAYVGRQYSHYPRVSSTAKPRYFDYIERYKSVYQYKAQSYRASSYVNRYVIDSCCRIYEKQRVARISAQNKAFEERQQKYMPNCAFKPYIDEKSRELTKNQEPFLQKIDVQIQMQNYRRKTLVTQNELRELEQCPFKPEINDNAVKQPGSVFDRLYQEGLQRLNAIQVACQQAAARAEVYEVQECTFYPKINENADLLAAQRAARIIFNENARYYDSFSSPAVSLNKVRSSSAESPLHYSVYSDKRSAYNQNNNGSDVYARGIKMKEHYRLLQELNESTACLLASSTHCTERSEVLATGRVERFVKSVFDQLQQNGLVGCLQLGGVYRLTCYFAAKKLISEILIENAAGIDFDVFRATFIYRMHGAAYHGDQINISYLGRSE